MTLVFAAVNMPFLQVFSQRKYSFASVFKDFGLSCIALCFHAIAAIKHDYVPQPKGRGGHITFGADPVGVPSFLHSSPEPIGGF